MGKKSRQRLLRSSFSLTIEMKSSLSFHRPLRLGGSSDQSRSEAAIAATAAAAVAAATSAGTTSCLVISTN